MPSHSMLQVWASCTATAQSWWAMMNSLTAGQTSLEVEVLQPQELSERRANKSLALSSVFTANSGIAAAPSTAGATAAETGA